MYEATIEPAEAAKRVWDDLHSRYRFLGDTYSIAQGDANIALITHTEKQVVIKIPVASCMRDAEDTAYFESSIVSSLQEYTEAPPVTIPRALIYDTSPLPYGMYSYLPGNIVSNDEIRRWPNERQIALGSKIGAFVAWMASAMPLEQYKEIRASARYADIFNRDDYLHGALIKPRYEQLAKYNQGIATFFASARQLYRSQKSAGLLKPTITGHDDLYTGNMVFSDDKTLQGIFDFGLTKPSSPERELRHTATMGSAVAHAAIAEYERQTNTKLNVPLLGFWAIAQTATNLEFTILHNDPTNIKIKHNDMATIGEWLASLHGS
jgi:hypothetical protein